MAGVYEPIEPDRQQRKFLERSLNIIPGDRGGRIMIPGCEPGSFLSSPALAVSLAEECAGTFAIVEEALEAIPGSSVQFFPNMEFITGYRLFVLPEVALTCPCPDNQDFYQILRDIAVPSTDPDTSNPLGNCSSFDYKCTESGGVGNTTNADISRFSPKGDPSVDFTSINSNAELSRFAPKPSGL